MHITGKISTRQLVTLSCNNNTMTVITLEFVPRNTVVLQHRQKKTCELEYTHNFGK